MLPTPIRSFLFQPLLYFFLFISGYTASAQQDTSVNIFIGSSAALSSYPSKPNHSRIKWVAIANVAGYGGTMVGLNSAWYSQYDKSRFHTFDDNSEWLQVDKVGHAYSAYIESRYSSEMWKWAGLSRKKRIWIGGMSGAVYQTVIEVLDGFSSAWGWSWSDFAANIAGSGIFVSQELAWDQQRIKYKFSVHKTSYDDPILNKRANDLYGKSFAERSIKDYNAQSYWLSANIHSFLPKSNVPRWLSVAVGYGANGMFGANGNVWTEKNGITYDRRDIKRYRQWFLAPDIDLTRIKTKSKFLRILFGVLDPFKFPTPSLELSNGNLKWNWLHF